MSSSIEIVSDNSDEVKKALKDQISTALEACGLQAEGYAKMLCPVDTGNLRNSLTHDQIDEYTEAIGTNVDYAAYV